MGANMTKKHFNRHLIASILVVFLLSMSNVALLVGEEDARRPYQPGPLLEKFLGETNGTTEIVFTERVSGRDHWYVTFGYYSCQEGPATNLGFGQFPDGKVVRGYGEGGRLCRLNRRTNRYPR
jgi:hypothetical protein